MKIVYILTFLFAICTVQASNYYVATDGDDGDPGTLGEPFRTLTYAMSTAGPASAGDSIYVEAGNYGGEKIKFEISGTVSNRIVIQGYKTTPGDQPKDDWQYLDAHITSETPYYDRSFDGVGMDFQEQEYITVNNFQITEYSVGVQIDGGHNIIENFYISEQGLKSANNGYGIYMRGNKLPIDGELKGFDADSCKVINCLVVNATLSNITCRSDYDTIINCRIYADDNSTGDDSSSDYLIALSGNYSIIKYCYGERVGNLDRGIHGMGVKGSWLGSSNPGGGNPCEYNEIIGCTLRNVILEGFWFAHNNTRYNLVDSCHVIQGNSAFTVRDSAHLNTFSNSSADSILFGTRPSVIRFRDGTEDIEGFTSCNNTFERLLITNSGAVLEFDDILDNDPESNDNEFNHLTMYNCTYFINYLDNVNSGNTVTNCIFYDIDDDYYSTDETDNISYTYNDFFNNGFAAFAGAGNIEVDPLFTSAAGYDWTIQEGSLCIDAGTDLGDPYNGTAPDMGYWESDYGPPVIPPPPVYRFGTTGSGAIRTTGGGKFIK